MKFCWHQLMTVMAGPGSNPVKNGRTFRWAIMVVGCALMLLFAPPLCAQGGQTANGPPKPLGYVLPEANRPPDANDRMVMQQEHQKAEDFEKVNAARLRQINDESTKLLILARDVKVKMELAGTKPLPPELIKEAEVIELLAHDVQQKMKVTVGGS
jgi:hypothetical protein